MRRIFIVQNHRASEAPKAAVVMADVRQKKQKESKRQDQLFAALQGGLDPTKHNEDLIAPDWHPLSQYLISLPTSIGRMGGLGEVKLLV